MSSGEGASGAPPPAVTDSVQEAIITAVMQELEEVASGLELHAEKLLKLYGDLAMDGEREAAAFRKVALDLRHRIQSIALRRQ